MTRTNHPKTARALSQWLDHLSEVGQGGLDILARIVDYESTPYTNNHGEIIVMNAWRLNRLYLKIIRFRKKVKFYVRDDLSEIVIWL